MSDTTDILRIATSFLDQQESKKQQAFENSMQLMDVARRYERQDQLDTLALGEAAINANKNYQDQLTTLGMTPQEFGGSVNYDSIQEIVNNSAMPIFDRMKKLQTVTRQINQNANMFINDRNNLVADLYKESMKDLDPNITTGEFNTFVSDLGRDLTDYESRWLQTVLSENKEKTVVLENNIASIATTDINSDIVEYVIDGGLTPEQASKKILKKIENSDKTDAEKRIYRSKLLDIVGKASKASGTSADADSQANSYIKDDLESQRRDIKGLMDYIVSDAPVYGSRFSTFDLSSESVKGDLEGMSQKLFEHILSSSKDWGVEDVYFKEALATANSIVNPNKKMEAINDVLDYAYNSLVTNEGKAFDDFDFNQGKGGKGNLHTGLGGFISRGLIVREKTKKYDADLTRFKASTRAASIGEISSLVDIEVDEPNNIAQPVIANTSTGKVDVSIDKPFVDNTVDDARSQIGILKNDIVNLKSAFNATKDKYNIIKSKQSDIKNLKLELRDKNYDNDQRKVINEQLSNLEKLKTNNSKVAYQMKKMNSIINMLANINYKSTEEETLLLSLREEYESIKEQQKRNK